MRSKMKVLGFSCLLLAVIFIGFGCEIPGTGSSNNDSTATGGTSGTGGTGGTGGFGGGGTTGGATGATNTASGTYSYNSGTLVLTTTTSNFPVNEGPTGTETITVTSLTATQMTWAFTDGSNDMVMFTRSNGVAGNINGTWTGSDSGDSIVVTMNNGAWSVVVTNTTSGTGTGGTTGGNTGSSVNISGTWQGTYNDTYTTDIYGHKGSGTIQFTFFQSSYISGTGFTKEYGTNLANNCTITGGQVNGNNLGMDLSQSGSDSFNTWTTTTRVSGTINGNQIIGSYNANTIVQGMNPRVYTTSGTYTLNK